MAGVNVRAVVLLVPGTTQNEQSQFSWNYQRALTKAGIAWCAVSPPFERMGDIQIAAEYDVYAIRTMYKAAGRKINVMRHSQGWHAAALGLKFWPDTRDMVSTWSASRPPTRAPPRCRCPVPS